MYTDRCYYWTAFVLLLCLLASPLAADVGDVYPIPGGVAGVTFDYLDAATLGVTASPENGYFSLSGRPGFVYVTAGLSPAATDDGRPVARSIGEHDGTIIEIPIAIALGRAFVANLPLSTREGFGIIVRIVEAPGALPGGGIEHVSTLSIPMSRVPDTAGNHIVRAVFRPRWLDTRIRRIEVRVTPFLGIATTGPGRPYSTGPMAASLETRRRLADFDESTRPYLVPIALIGAPPGDRSTATYSSTFRSSVTFAISEGASESVTNRESFGFGGLLNFSSPTYTTRRSDSQGIHQQLRFAQSSSWSSPTGGLGPGLDDIMVCLLYPSLHQYRTAHDRDFRYQAEPPTYVSFPMRALLTRGMNDIVDNLSEPERQALIGLNPLLLDPAAELPSPRYILIERKTPQAGPGGGSVRSSTINQRLEDHRRAHGTIEEGGSSFKLPIGAAASAVGLPVPSSFAAAYRSEETVTREIEFRTDHGQLSASEIDLTYQLADSDPNRVLDVEIYYDTFFRTLVFRDVSGRSRPQVLWSNPSGSTSLWSLDRTDAYKDYQYISTPAGARAESYTRGSDGRGRILWSFADGRAVLATIDGVGRPISSRQIGQRSGWRVACYRKKADGTARLVWADGNGRASIQVLDASSTAIGQVDYGPYGGWTPTSYETLPDGTNRLLWSHVDGWASLWTLDGRDAYRSHRYEGPYGGWQATDYRHLPDGTRRLVWTSPGSGWSSVWQLDDRDRRTSHTFLHGSFGWSAIGYSPGR